jgi:hypothetical protein
MRRIPIPTLCIFIILTVLLSDYSGVSDGLTKIGFPFVFMQDTGGKCNDCSALKLFNWWYLVTDMLFSFGLYLVLVTIHRFIKIKKQIK